eukprot:scpid46596/ scgid24898/ FH protein interacting protein FIP2; BTB/POZ domain-containing protein At5g55000
MDTSEIGQKPLNEVGHSRHMSENGCLSTVEQAMDDVSKLSVEDVFREQLHKRRKRQIKLNVGGRMFVTSLTTLSADPDSMLAAMFSGRHELDVDKQDMSVFIDRNGQAFASILEWLRTGLVPASVLQSDSERKAVLVEAKYFQLESLASKLEEVDSQCMEGESGMADLLDCGIIKLNVGGKLYSTSRTTLTSDTSSMLACMFSGRHNVHRDENGCIFIDRDGELFAHVLNWLRSRTVPPLDPVTKAGLLTEAQYFQLTDLAAALSQGDITDHRCLRQITPEIFYSSYQSSLVNNQPLVFSYVDLRLIPSMAGLFLAKADLRGSNLSGICLRNTTLEEANLNGTLFSSCDIRGANLRGAVLIDATLDSANLQNALMDRCRLAGASLVNADLRQAYMRSTRVSRTNFQGALTEGTHGLEIERSSAARGNGAAHPPATIPT